MKPMYFFFLATLLFPLQNTRAIVSGQEFSAPAACTVTTLLKIGSKSAEVSCLQSKLEIFSDGKFGPLTKTAVMNFQLGKGLIPDGVVGPLTRAMLSEVAANASFTPRGCAVGMNYDPMTGKLCSEASVPEITKAVIPVLPAKEPADMEKIEAKVPANLANLDKFIATVVAVQKKKGISEKEADTIAETLRKEVLASGIDYNKEFESMLETEAKLSSTAMPNIFDKVLAKTFSFFGLAPVMAEAATGIPFGGALIFPYYCAVSSNWMITLTPLPPSYAVLLSYTPFTQGFASYNMPYTRFLLGSYVTGGVCSYGYVNIPTEGTITSKTGSSPI